jgi:hypothetical protein
MKITARNATLALLALGTLTLSACVSHKPADEAAPAAQAAPADASAPAADSGATPTP